MRELDQSGPSSAYRFLLLRAGAGRVPAIFSEWMDRGSLKNCIRDGSLYEGGEDDVAARILDIAIRSEQGLRYSHDNDLIHQDVKPGNLLLSEDWNVKVADFGLAKARSSGRMT